MFTTNPFDDDKLHEECGVFGIYQTSDAAKLTALGLHALQHRGQEAAGIVTFDYISKRFMQERRMGQVADKFTRGDVIDRLKGQSAIGHVRYSTSGGTVNRNIQPLYADLAQGGFAIAHNGNLTNAKIKRRELINKGAIFQSTTDTETIVHLVAHSDSHLEIRDKLIQALQSVEGAYSLVALSANGLIGVRDPLGVRPLVLGRKDDAYILASETCALDIIGADFIRDIQAGEMVIIHETGIDSIFPFKKTMKRFCVFEYIYFARPDSVVESKSVYNARKAIGAELAKESGIDADVVVPVPDSGNPAAMGYAMQANIPFELGIIRNHYVGRTFIQPSQTIRDLGVKLKHNPNMPVLKGKRVILIDDSIVRGTTSKNIVDLVRKAGAKEVHMRIASPPTTHSCFYGVDTPEREKLMAANYSIDEMCKLLGADSLAFISIDGLYRALGHIKRDPSNPYFCDACFTGEYPTPLADHSNDDQMNLLSLLNEVE